MCKPKLLTLKENMTEFMMILINDRNPDCKPSVEQLQASIQQSLCTKFILLA